MYRAAYTDLLFQPTDLNKQKYIAFVLELQCGGKAQF